MKITLEDENYIVTIDNRKTCDVLDEAIEMVRAGLLAIGYHPDGVALYIGEDV